MKGNMEHNNTYWSKLLERKLLINIGKGGVGRSTLSAALARAAAKQGKRVLVCEVNAKERMSGLLGGRRPESLDTLDQIWQVDDNLWTVNIEPWTAMKEYVVQVLRLKLVYNLVFENRMMKYFLRGVPGLQELVFAGKVWFHVAEDKVGGSPRFDLVIVDAPATGHGFAMLRIANVVLSISPPGPMRNAAQKMVDVLADQDDTWINLVTLPEEMPVQESIELYEKIEKQLGFPLGYTWINQWPANVCSSEQEELLAATQEKGLEDPTGWPMWLLAERATFLKNRAEEQEEWLKQHVPLPIMHVPYEEPGQRTDKEWVSALSEKIEQQLMREAVDAS